MKKLFNSSGLLIDLILVFIGVLGNRKATIDLGIQKAIAKVVFNDRSPFFITLIQRDRKVHLN